MNLCMGTMPFHPLWQLHLLQYFSLITVAWNHPSITWQRE